MQPITAEPGTGQLTVSTFGTPYIIQQLQSNPQVTRSVGFGYRRRSDVGHEPSVTHLQGAFD